MSTPYGFPELDDPEGVMTWAELNCARVERYTDLSCDYVEMMSSPAHTARTYNKLEDLFHTDVAWFCLGFFAASLVWLLTQRH